MFTNDVCVIGVGRVGLPLSLSLIESGLEVVGFDIDKRLIESINNGVMPFKEPGYSELIKMQKLKVYKDAKFVIQNSKSLIITVGTPIMKHMETDLSQIENVLISIKDFIVKDQLIILRSTVSPGTTKFVSEWIESYTNFKIGKDIFLSFCPERIAEGHAYSELKSLPQIIGSEDEKSKNLSGKLFGVISPQLLFTNFINAELVKLINNITRYVNFSLANQLALISDDLGGNIFEARRLANYNYPRCDLPSPGLTAGTCLRKDFGMLNEWSPYPDILLSAWKMNEYTPVMLVKQMSKRITLLNKVVTILGYTFKRDTDDIRDSLVPKLYRYIKRCSPSDILISDHNLPGKYIEDTGNILLENCKELDAMKKSDCVFIAINHSGYLESLKKIANLKPNLWVADIWNVGLLDKVYYQAYELLKVKS